MDECWVIALIGLSGSLKFLSKIDHVHNVVWKTSQLNEARKYRDETRAGSAAIDVRSMHHPNDIPAIRVITYDSAVALVMAREIRRG